MPLQTFKLEFSTAQQSLGPSLQSKTFNFFRLLGHILFILRLQFSTRCLARNLITFF